MSPAAAPRSRQGPDRRREVPDNRLAELRERLGLQSVPDELLELAFRHTSYTWENGLDELASNQRLEYLGDAVLDLVFAAYLYATHPDLPEGDLTRLKAALVRESALASIARDLGLGDYLLLGRGEETSGGRDKASLLADLVEALVGAIFLSGGYEDAHSFVLGHFESLLEDVTNRDTLSDHKSVLQEMLQTRGEMPPTYVVVRTEGPPHDRRFTVEAGFRGPVIGRGHGGSKRAAEQEAAAEALDGADEWLP